MTDLPESWWQDKATLERVVREHGTFAQAAHAVGGVTDKTLQVWWHKHDLGPVRQGRPPLRATDRGTLSDTDAWLIEALKKLGDNATVEEIADHEDVSPRRVREAAERLGLAGFRIGETDGRVVLSRVAPDTTSVHPGLFTGTDFRIGVVSDTHLGSKEEAVDELRLAYDMFADKGITTVLHAGDIVCGRGIFRGQEQETKVYTLDDQFDWARENYPRHDGITTYAISGNHDVEGEAGRVGYDPVKKLASVRPDIKHMGSFSAWMEFGGAWVHLLHGKGGMSYAYSYKAQKLVDGYPAGRKPSILIPGHWHVRGNVRHREVEVLWPGCFEWQSSFLKRLGLHPAVGFHIVDFTVGEDGSLVRWRPEWFPFYAGRSIAA